MKLPISLTILVLCCSISISITHGQSEQTAWKTNPEIVDGSFNQANNSSTSSNSSSSHYNIYFNPGEEASPYLFEEWKEGSLTLKDKTLLTDRKLRYNIYNQQFEFILENDTAAIANPEDISEIKIDGHCFVYLPFVCQNAIHKGYMEKLYEGEITLLLHRYIKYETSGKSTNSNSPEEDIKYYRADTYYYWDDNEFAKLFPDKKKQVMGILHDPSRDLESYFKKSKNKLKTKEDFINLFENYFGGSP
ncbi:MAG: hypothetical protein K9H49_05680 [Bacteroidales bacterium]|nr:hypothetical protein [Bacteroidales bacterium]MCF8404402.1 hypothetical protein [Bacteroidales bacterium]